MFSLMNNLVVLQKSNVKIVGALFTEKLVVIIYSRKIPLFNVSKGLNLCIGSSFVH